MNSLRLGSEIMEKHYSKTVPAWSQPPLSLNPRLASYYLNDLWNITTSLGLNFLS